jgi:hypothetical protein
MTREERMDPRRCWNDTQREELEAIAQDGCVVIKVFGAGAGEEWAYTVGLEHSYGHPEVLILGLSHELTQILLHNIASRIMRKGLSFRHGTSHTDVIDGYQCFFQRIAQAEYGEYFAAAEWFYDHTDFEAVQIIWPDVEGIYPWQPGASDDFKRVQPVLTQLPSRFLQ